MSVEVAVVLDALQDIADEFADNGFTHDEWRMLGVCNCAHCEVGDGICPMRVNAMVHDRLEKSVHTMAQLLSRVS